MKEMKVTRKLELNKRTICGLDQQEMTSVRGGSAITMVGGVFIIYTAPGTLWWLCSGPFLCSLLSLF